MKRLLYALPILALVGCMATGVIKNETTTTKPDGTVTTSVTKAVLPKYPDGEATYTSPTGETITLPKSQDQAKIEGTKGDAKNVRLLYIGAGILLIIGGIGLALPNYWVSNKDAAMVIAAALISFGALRFVESSEKIMGYVIPVAIVCGIGFIGFNYYKNRQD